MDNKEKTITLSIERYKYLEERDNWLLDLEAAGVNNWEGYDYACELRRERLGIE